MNRRVGQSLFIRIFRQGMVSPWERIKSCLYVLFFTLGAKIPLFILVFSLFF